MFPPGAIDKLRKEREEREQPALRLPIYLPDIIHQNEINEDEGMREGSMVIVIDLLQD